ncbi:hypothetical protein BMJ24_02455, partial [Sinorhizobium medicae]
LETLRVAGNSDRNIWTAHRCLVAENRKRATLRHEREGRMLRFLLAITLGAVAGEAAAGCNKELLNVEGWSAKSMAERRVEVSMDLRSTAPKPIRIIGALVYFRDALDEDIGS